MKITELIKLPDVAHHHDWNQRDGYTPVNFWIGEDEYLLMLGVSQESNKIESNSDDVPDFFESKTSIEIWEAYIFTPDGNETKIHLTSEEENLLVEFINSKLWK